MRARSWRKLNFRKPRPPLDNRPSIHRVSLNGTTKICRADAPDTPILAAVANRRRKLAPAATARVPPNPRPVGLFDDYFVREKESSAAVVKLHQEHATVQIVHLAKNPGLLLKSTAPLMIPYKPDQSAKPPHHLGIDAFHCRFHLSHS